MHADHGADRLALRRHPSEVPLAGAAGLAHPLGRRPGLAILGGDADVAAEADRLAEAQFAEEGEQLLVAEAAVSQDRHPAPRRHQFG